MSLAPTKPQRVMLHTVLIAGSIVFLLPYVWLLGSSWKLDKEVQSSGLELLPQMPEPRPRSPYIDERTFDLTKPRAVSEDDWNRWMRQAVINEISTLVADCHNGLEGAMSLDREVATGELTEGVFGYVVNILPPESWRLNEPELRAAIRNTVTKRMIDDAFERSLRYFALGQMLIKDQRYQIYAVGADRTAQHLWTTAEGDAQITPRQVFDRSVALISYDLNHDDSISVTAKFPLPCKWEDFKRISISYRRDQTWHAMKVFLEINGTRYATEQPQYLGADDFAEASFQLPSDDDRRLSSKLYTLIKPVGTNLAYDHGEDILRVVVQLGRSSVPQALYAKGTENYRDVFKQVPFLRYLSTSAFLALMNIIGTCLSCSLAAYALARLRWPGRNLCFILVLATLMIPPQVTMIPSFVIYKQLGWYNTLAPLWAPAFFGINAFAIFLLRQAMKGIPRDLEDAARIDGCGYFRTYWHVALPLMKPTLAAISVFTFMYVWNDFMGPLIYVNDQRLYPAALGLFAFMAGREEQFTWVMAASVLMTLPVIAIFFALQRYFIQGVALTGMKG